jgi:hypothetical protein
MEITHYHIVHYQYESHPASSSRITLDELVRLSRVHREIIIKMVDWGLVEPVENEPEPLFYETAVPRIWRILRLREDLGINWTGIGVVLELLERIEGLERQLAHLKKKL